MINSKKVNLQAMINDDNKQKYGIENGNQKIYVPKVKKEDSHYEESYLIPPKYLSYNNQNGRIKSSMITNKGNGKNINDLIKNDLKDSKLEDEIRKYGQEVPGYVLNDGTIIDGNRRFTAISEINREDKKNNNNGIKFEAIVISSLDSNKDKKLIKELEAKIQFGSSPRKDYDAIDKAIDIHQNIVSNIITNTDYANITYMSLGTINRFNVEGLLINKFLNYINGKNENHYNYDLAKELNLDGPLEDMISTYNNYIKDNKNEVIINESLFSILIKIHFTKTDKDFKSNFRPIVNKIITDNKYRNDFVEHTKPFIEHIHKILKNKSINSLDDLRKIIIPNIKNKIWSDFNKTLNKYVFIAKSKNIPSSINKINTEISNIKNHLHKTNINNDFNKNQVDEMRDATKKINNAISDLLDYLNPNGTQNKKDKNK